MLPAALAATVLLAQASAPPAATPAAEAAPPPKEVAPVIVEGRERDPMVCKVRKPMGSQVPKKTCQRKSEVEQARHDGRQIAEDLQRKDPFYRPIEP